MRKIISVVFIILFISNGNSQRKLKKLDVKEEGVDVKLNFQPIVDQINYKGLSIKVTPVSANELNDVFYNESFFNGKFNYSYFKKSRKSYFLTKKKGKRKKSDLEFFIDGISWLLDNDKINEKEYEELERQIIYYYDEEYATKFYSSNVITANNPYFFNNRYFTVFKVNLKNSTSSHIKLDKDFIVENGNNLLNLVGSQTLLNDLDDKHFNVNKSIALERYHLKKGIVVPPNTDTQKFLAILPLNYNNSVLKMSLEGLESKLSWKIIKDEKIIDKFYTFYELPLNLKGDTENDLKFNILNGDRSSIFIDDNRLFVGEESVNKTFEIFTISMDRNTLNYGRNSNLKAIDFIDKEKNKRKTITLDNEKIEEIKRKVKE